MAAQEEYAGRNEIEVLIEKLSQVFGNSDIATLLVQALTPLFQQHFGASARFGGNVEPFMFGSQSFFAPTNVGSEFFIQAQRDTIQSSYADAQKTLNDARNQFARQANQYLFGGDANGNATFSGLAFDAAFHRLETDQLLAGFGTGARYMGVMAGLGGTDPDRLARTGLMADAVAEDFPRNLSAYGGMRGRDVGRVYAELSRTGGFSGILAEEDVEKAKADTIDLVQKTSQSISEFRSIFQGSVTQVMDSVNSLLGTDVAATFEDAGRGLASRMSTTGFVTNTSPAQMQAAMASSAGMLRQAGLGSINAASSTLLFSELSQVSRVSGDNKFIDPTAYRQTLLRQSTGAMESAIARDISGAYAIGADTGALEAAIAQGDVRSLADVARLTGLDAQAIRSAGYSQEAALLRAEGGVGGLAAMQGGVGAISDARRRYIERAFGGAEVEGPLTIENITSELGLNVSQAGDLRRAFGLQAKSMGFGSAEAMDKYINTIANDAEMDSIRRSIQEQQAFKNKFSGMGKAFGIGDMVEMAQAGELGTSKENLFRLLSGQNKIGDVDLDEYFEGLTWLEGRTALGGNAAGDAAGLAARALVTNTVAGSRMTADQAAAARAIFAPGEENRAAKARAFMATVASPAARGSVIDALMSKEGLNGVNISDRESADRYLALGQIGSLDRDAFAVSGLAAEKEESFFKTAEAYRSALKEGRELDFFGKSGFMEKDAFEQAFRTTAREYKSVYAEGFEASDRDSTQKLISVLEQLSKALLALKVQNPVGTD